MHVVIAGQQRAPWVAKEQAVLQPAVQARVLGAELLWLGMLAMHTTLGIMATVVHMAAVYYCVCHCCRYGIISSGGAVLQHLSKCCVCLTAVPCVVSPVHVLQVWHHGCC
jgi:hypothetical protein